MWIMSSRKKEQHLTQLKIMLNPGAIEPTKSHEDDAGYDLYSPGMAIIPAHKRAVIDTGVCVDIPKGYYARLESKSGLMRDKGITVRGTIDAGYRGSIKVVLFNHSDETVSFERGDKITQIVFLKCESPTLKVVESFDGNTDRGENGFGSTGK